MLRSKTRQEDIDRILAAVKALYVMPGRIERREALRKRQSVALFVQPGSGLAKALARLSRRIVARSKEVVELVARYLYQRLRRKPPGRILSDQSGDVVGHRAKTKCRGAFRQAFGLGIEACLEALTAGI
jgi:hypothetical protein